MSFDIDELYALLPEIQRTRDAELGGPLRALLSVIADQIVVLEDNLAQRYDDQFVETAAPWALPYLGDLVGITGLPRVPSPRAEVADTIGYRRRKGTPAMLEQLARDLSGAPAKVVELFQLLATTQYMNHIRLANQSVFSVRGVDRNEYLGTPFEHLAGQVDTACVGYAGGQLIFEQLPRQVDLAHTADVRRIGSGRGRYNIPNIGIFLYRLRAYSLTDSPAVAVDGYRYRFDPLGGDVPLWNSPLTQDDPTVMAVPVNVPMPITRRVLARALPSGLPDYYGDSLLVSVEGEPAFDPKVDIVACDLSGWDANWSTASWASTPKAKVGIDPVLGRIVFRKAPPAGKVRVTFHYGFSADMGGGEYERSGSFVVQPAPGVKVVAVKGGGKNVISAALATLGTGGGVVEIQDSGRYEETKVHIPAGHVELRAADKFRPTLVMGGDIVFDGGADAQATLNGLLVTFAAGHGVSLTTVLGALRILHCTLVPVKGAASLTVSTATAAAESIAIQIDHSITGALYIGPAATVTLTASIVDAGDETGVAYAGADGAAPGGTLHVENTTVVGKVSTSVMELASNTLFVARLKSNDTWTAPVRVLERQTGCVRFSYVPPGSLTPRRHRCQPVDEGSADLVSPRFTSLSYGDAAYAQLTPACPDEIRRGADDASEMGVFHDLQWPAREAHLRARLDEYLRFGLEAGIFYAT